MFNIQFYIRKIKRNYYDAGLLVTLKRGLFYLIKAIYAHDSYIVFRLDTNKALKTKTNNARIVYLIYKDHEPDVISQMTRMEEWLHNVLQSKLKSNQYLCVYALERDKVVGFILAAINEFQVPLFEGLYVSKPGYAWMEQMTVSRNHRKQGIASTMLSCLLEELKKRNIKRLYGKSLINNAASIETITKSGGKLVMEIHRLKRLDNVSWQARTIKNNNLSNRKNLKLHEIVSCRI